MEKPKNPNPSKSQGTMDPADGTGIPPSDDTREGHGLTPPNLQAHGNAGRESQKGGSDSNNRGTQGGNSQTGRRDGLDRNQDLNKENREGEMPKSESDVLDEPPFDSRMPGEPPRGADNTAPDED